MSVLPDCDYVCVSCGLTTCRDQAPSAAEDRRICNDCAAFLEVCS